MKYPDFKDASITHDIKAKCKDGAAKFRSQVIAKEGEQLCTNMMAGATLAGAWEWKGLLNGALTKLKVGGKGVDCHVDAGRKSFLDNNIHHNFWYSVNVPNKAHPMDVWQWTYKMGSIATWGMYGWNSTSTDELTYSPNATKTGPGAIQLKHKHCYSKNQHEIHFNTDMTTAPGGSMAPEITAAYQFKESDKMSYLKVNWHTATNKFPFIHSGGSYKVNNYANLAYRMNYSHPEKKVCHSIGAEGKCSNGDVYYKAHLDVNNSYVEDK